MKYFIALMLFAWAWAAAPAASKKVSPIVSVGADGRLHYEADEQGNRLPDFSNCGYAGGDRPIPLVPVRVQVAPFAGDETARIQKALDYVGALPADGRGLRGAVLLLSGRHEVFGALLVTNSGVVLRGQGMGESGTLLVAAGMDRRTLLHFAGRHDVQGVTNADWEITDACVPAGANGFHLRSADGLKSGDRIFLTRPSTREWIESLGMTDFGGGIGDWRLVWKPGSRDLVWDRVIQNVAGNFVTVNAPVTVALEPARGGGWVQKYFWPGRIENIGVENLRLQSDVAAANPRDENHAWMAVTLDNVVDAWVRQVTFTGFAGSAVAVYEGCHQVTVMDCLSLAPVSEVAGFRRHTFFTMGQQTLFLRCWAERGRHDFSVGHGAAGPNAFVQCTAVLPSADSGPVESAAGGVLYDNVCIDGGGLSLMNRGSAGQGAGWSAFNSVLWQCSASHITCENPPGACNFAFGCWGEFAGNGVWRNSNASVRPESLFAAQVADRLGASAAEALQLMSRSLEEFSNPTPEQAVKLVENSRRPAPSLRDYIVAAGIRQPLAGEVGNAIAVEKVPDPAPGAAISPSTIAVTNGWLVCNGRLLVGTVAGINWWRGNLRPGDAANYGLNLTRFAPGRVGAGYTDDLPVIADGMSRLHQAALDHHYGLWYDRRREDHERVRRVDADVWPPFYEQPFARSGSGSAWDGLSQYDLTQFNPWYWSRLRMFAALCDARGLVLFNENYFQHNILEAGAHWVDCPWRSTNNLNNTDFPEPPPFAGDKRIFMAAQFYDVSHPVRRRLHQQFIRQNLDNFTNQANVIQFTSAEFTGPLAFEQFWLDTISEWEQAAHRHPLIALAATKDVQDAILADPPRCALVDVVCFRYWWQTDRGLFAPPAGQNLSPRQSERRWKGGMPGDDNLAAMVAGYRQRFPHKVFLASGEDADLSRNSWAFVCAGGSLPNLPPTTSPELLAAIPQMQPWLADVAGKLWALRQPGRQILICCRGGRLVDLSAETGAFRAYPVNAATGEVMAGEKVLAGARVQLPASAVVWLVKE